MSSLPPRNQSLLPGSSFSCLCRAPPGPYFQMQQKSPRIPPKITWPAVSVLVNLSLPAAPLSSEPEKAKNLICHCPPNPAPSALWPLGIWPLLCPLNPDAFGRQCLWISYLAHVQPNSRDGEVQGQRILSRLLLPPHLPPASSSPCLPCLCPPPPLPRPGCCSCLSRLHPKVSADVTEWA